MDRGYDSSEDEDEIAQSIRHRKRCSEILPQKLYLSSCDVAAQSSVIKEYNIAGIISLGSFEEHVHYKMHREPEYLFIFIDDHASEPIHQHFKECIEFINATQGPVLVHCAAGISRSATIVIAYLMVNNKMDYHDAIAYVKSKRPIIRPNHGFLLQLREL